MSPANISPKILQALIGPPSLDQQNALMNEACARVCQDLAHDGLYSCILGGQANLQYYPQELRGCRRPSLQEQAIDVWCAPMDSAGLDMAVSDLDGRGAHYEKFHGAQAVKEYARINASPNATPHATPNVNYLYSPASVRGIIRNARLQRWFRENEQFNTARYAGFNVASVSFNVIYQLARLSRLKQTDITLQQMLDYYFVLRALHVEQGTLADRTESMAQWAESMGVAVMSNDQIRHKLKRFGLLRLAQAVMYVLQQEFEMPPVYMICQPNEKRGRKLLEAINRE